jgi:hypothetical protein
MIVEPEAIKVVAKHGTCRSRRSSGHDEADRDWRLDERQRKALQRA